MGSHSSNVVDRVQSAVREGRLRLPVAALATGVLVLLLAACDPHPQTTLSPESDYANNIQNLFVLTCWAGLVVFVLVEGAMIYAALRFRRKPGDPRPPLLPGNRVLEIAWTAAPVLILTVIGVPTIGLVFQSGGDAPSSALQVTAIGHQWWFEFQYPDQKIVTANEMHIPVGQPVNIALKSADVMHSLWIPKLAGKRDMIPNHTNYLWFTPQKMDTYYGECAEFCGVSHANMGFRVVVQSQADFDAWVKTQQQPAIAPSTPQQQAGQQVFSGSCAVCHQVGATAPRGFPDPQAPSVLIIGPNLTHIASRSTIAAAMFPNDPTSLAQWLGDPPAEKPGNLMGLVIGHGVMQGQQLNDLVAYLDSLK